MLRQSQKSSIANPHQNFNALTRLIAYHFSLKSINHGTTQSLTIFEPENVRTLAELAPRSYQENQLSHVRCLEAGNALLLKVQKEGMNDALDVEIARFIEKAKLTVRKMYGKRTPVTQLFDRIRKVYTAMEADVDPSKPDSIPGQLQAARNAFARRKHEEEERRRRQEAAKVAHDNALDRYRSDVEEDYLRQFNALISNSINTLYAINRGITLKISRRPRTRSAPSPTTSLPDGRQVRHSSP